LNGIRIRYQSVVIVGEDAVVEIFRFVRLLHASTSRMSSCAYPPFGESSRQQRRYML
jgi:hypothetical protein